MADDRLPSELIALIFRHVLSSSQPDISLGNPKELSSSIQDCLAAICLVSRRWNTIAHDTPALWSTIVIILGRDRATSTPHSHVARRVKRAKNSLLDVCIAPNACADLALWIANSSKSQLSVDSLRSLETLKLQKNRWRTLRLHNIRGSAEFKALVPSSLPRLEDVILANVVLERDEPPSPSVSAPRLHAITSISSQGDSPVDEEYYSAFKDCSDLESCILHQPSDTTAWTNLMSFLSQNGAAIQRLEIRKTAVTAALTLPRRGVHFSCTELAELRELCIDGSGELSITWLFGHLRVPQLRTVEISDLTPILHANFHSLDAPNLHLIRFRRARSLSAVCHLVSKIRNSKQIAIELDRRLGLLPGSAKRPVFEQLKANKLWLERNTREVRWIPQSGKEDKMIRRETLFATYEEANGFVAR